MSVQRVWSWTMTLVFLAVVASGVLAQSDTQRGEGQGAAGIGGLDPNTGRETPAGETPPSAAESPAPDRSVSRQTLTASLTIFVLAVFVGFEVITKVPPTLHTPLMSGSNAISGITLVGALLVAGEGVKLSGLVGCVAVILASINVVGGFLVTHRMLAMFKKR